MNIKKYNKEDFISKAIAIHGNKYHYPKVNYLNSRTKVCIICPEHGEFWQTPHNHLKGYGCRKCGQVITASAREKTTDKFIEEAIKVHGNKYIYTNTIYHKWNQKVCIICPEHGEFWQTPFNHLNGSGCPKCANEKRSKANLMNISEFIKRSTLRHKGKYTYDKSVYNGVMKDIIITCPIHGDFKQLPDCHLRGGGCPKCAKQVSKAEDKICEILKCLNPQQRDRSILNGKEIDIYIPSLRIGIEYNGLWWHSEELGKNKNYHINKLEECNKQGIKLIQIFEDEWVNNREICISKLKHLCKIDTIPKIYARKCKIKEITNKRDAYDFLCKNHIQGKTGFTVGIGGYFNGRMVAVMTFKKVKDGCWELNRFATDINYRCIGIGGKLFTYFIKNYNVENIKTFADRRWTIDKDNNIYTKLGFKFNSFVRPSYWYYKQSDGCVRLHKFGFRKQLLHKRYNLPLSMTENEMVKRLGYTKIWDCGLIKYVWKPYR